MRVSQATPMSPVASSIKEAGSGFCIRTPAEVCVNPDVGNVVRLFKVKGAVAPLTGNGLKTLVLLTTSGLVAPVSGNGFKTVPPPTTGVDADVIGVDVKAAAAEGVGATALLGKKGALPEPDRKSVTMPLPGNARGAAAPVKGNGLKTLVLLATNGALAPANGNGLKMLPPVDINGAAAPLNGIGLKILALLETSGAPAPANGKGLKVFPPEKEVKGVPPAGKI